MDTSAGCENGQRRHWTNVIG